MTFRSYLLAPAFGVAAFNVACNAGYTWWLWRSGNGLPMAGPGGIGADLAMTPIWIGLLSVLLGTFFIRRAFADGRMLREADMRPHPLLARLPRGILPRALVMAGACGIAFAIPLSFLLPLLGDGVLTLTGAVGTKVLVTALFSLSIVPLVVLAAVGDVEPGGRPFSVR